MSITVLVESGEFIKVFCEFDWSDFDIEYYVDNSAKFTGRWIDNQYDEVELECTVEIETGMLWWKKSKIEVLWVDGRYIKFEDKIIWSEIKDCNEH